MFEILEHTADIGFRAQAPALPELFESAALALVSIAMETDNIVNRHSYSLEAYGDSNETLLVNWLNDVLYQLDGAHAAMRAFKITEFAPPRVRGEARGERRDPQRHEPKLVVKGVTYHQLRIEQTRGGWQCEVYLDI